MSILTIALGIVLVIFLIPIIMTLLSMIGMCLWFVGYSVVHILTGPHPEVKD